MLDIANDWKQKINEAVATAEQSDIAIIAAGIHEGEFQDRAILSLPGHQEDLINAVAATGKPVSGGIGWRQRHYHEQLAG